MYMRLLRLALVVVLLAGAAGCSGGSSGGSGGNRKPVVVGSKIDTEGAVLGQIIITLLENKGIQVVDKTKTGTTDVVRQALLSGEIDIYPEYTGTALSQFFPKATIPPGTTSNGTKSWELCKQLDQPNGIVWLKPSPANNTWAIAVPKKLADSKQMTTLVDWAQYIRSGNPVKLVCSQEFVDRSDALPAFEKAYDFTLSSSQLVILAGGDTAQTEAAASQGTDGANAAMAYGTDGSLAALDLVVLQDPKGVQPVYEPTPIIRDAVLKTYPEISGILDPVFQNLTLETLQKLNGKVAVDGTDPKQVARDYLKAAGYIK